jgi:hypothetical protein
MPFPSFPTQNTQSQIAIFDSDFNQLFPDAKILKVTVKPTSKIMEHPVETGATITDYFIVLPIELDIDIIATSPNYKNTYNLIKSAFIEAKLLTIQTKSDTFTSQIISELPHQEGSEMYDAILINLKTKQVLFITPQYGTVPISPRNPKNTSTNNLGNKSGAPVTPVETSAIRRKVGPIT